MSKKFDDVPGALSQLDFNCSYGDSYAKDIEIEPPLVRKINQLQQMLFGKPVHQLV